MPRSPSPLRDNHDRRGSSYERSEGGYGGRRDYDSREPPLSKTTLYVSGFDIELRARDLAWEFERYGPLIRCDMPALKTSSSMPFAFVEFRYADDAEDAYYDMHGREVDGRKVSVQWAKVPLRRRDTHRRERSPPPRRRSLSPPPRSPRASL